MSTCALGRIYQRFPLLFSAPTGGVGEAFFISALPSVRAGLLLSEVQSLVAIFHVIVAEHADECRYFLHGMVCLG